MGNQFTDFEERLLAEVSEDLLMEYNREIAKFIRNSGTEEELESFHYIESELKKAGIEIDKRQIDIQPIQETAKLNFLPETHFRAFFALDQGTITNSDSLGIRHKDNLLKK